jgi:uncharacterized protein YjdB
MQQTRRDSHRALQFFLRGALVTTFAFLLPATAHAATLRSITVTPANSSLTEGFAAQFTATANFSDGTTQNVTQIANWTTGSSHTAIVSNVNGTRGLVTAVNAGSVQISASITQGLSTTKGGTPLTVVPAKIVSIRTTPSNKKFDVGQDVQLAAKATFNNGQEHDVTQTVNWSSVNPSFATVGNTAGSNKGLVHTVKIGTAIIHAVDPVTGVSNSDQDGTVTVLPPITSLTITPNVVTIGKPLTFPLKANGNRADNSRSNLSSRVVWTTTPPGIVSIDQNGVITPLVRGTVTVSAMDPVSGLSTSGAGNAVVTIGARLVGIQVAPDPFNVAVTQNRNAQVIGTLRNGVMTTNLRDIVNWSVADPTIATVNNTNNKGAVTGVKIGTTTLTATEPLTGLVSPQTNNLVVRGAPTGVIMSPTSDKVPIGMTDVFKARATFSDGTDQNISEQCDWSIQNPALASVDNVNPGKGAVTGVALGNTTVKASCSGMIATGTVQVIGHLASISVTPNPFSAEASVQKQFRASGLYDDGSTKDLTRSLDWSSSNPAVATVDNNKDRGNVTMLAKGMTNITAMDNAGHSGSAALTVIGDLTNLAIVTPNGFTTLRGSTAVRFQAQGTFSDGSKQFLTGKIVWASSNPSIARVSNDPADIGTVTGGNTEGVATITVTSGVNPQIQASLQVTVKGILTSFSLTPTTLTIPLNQTRPVAAKASYNDGVQGVTVTKSVTFQSSNTAVAQVSNTPGSQGIVTAAGHGSASISAVDPSTGKTSTNSVAVTVP